MLPHTYYDTLFGEKFSQDTGDRVREQQNAIGLSVWRGVDGAPQGSSSARCPSPQKTRCLSRMFVVLSLVIIIYLQLCYVIYAAGNMYV